MTSSNSPNENESVRTLADSATLPASPSVQTQDGQIRSLEVPDFMESTIELLREMGLLVKALTVEESEVKRDSRITVRDVLCQTSDLVALGDTNEDQEKLESSILHDLQKEIRSRLEKRTEKGESAGNAPDSGIGADQSERQTAAAQVDVMWEVLDRLYPGMVLGGPERTVWKATSQKTEISSGIVNDPGPPDATLSAVSPESAKGKKRKKSKRKEKRMVERPVITRAMLDVESMKVKFCDRKETLEFCGLDSSSFDSNDKKDRDTWFKILLQSPWPHSVSAKSNGFSVTPRKVANKVEADRFFVLIPYPQKKGVTLPPRIAGYEPARSKANSKIYTCPVEGCGKLFHESVRCQIHSKFKHLDCQLCSRVLTEKGLSLHSCIEYIFPDRGQRCPAQGCQGVFTKKHKYENHRKSPHYICKKCGAIGARPTAELHRLKRGQSCDGKVEPFPFQKEDWISNVESPELADGSRKKKAKTSKGKRRADVDLDLETESDLETKSGSEMEPESDLQSESEIKTDSDSEG